MKLIRYGVKGKEKPGLYIDGERWDCSSFFKDWDHHFFNSDGLEKLAEVLSSGKLNQKVPGEMRWAPPISRPGMILCVGLNYSDHALEAKMEKPTEPILFMKATNTLCGPYDDVPYPKGSTKMDWEVELGIVIGQDALYLEDREAAENAIAGYCVVNDISERAFQLESGGQWVKGKSAPNFSPVGPWLLTKDEIEDVLDLSLHLSVNGQPMQNGNTSKMIFDPVEIVQYVSQFMKLEAGDLISTGTPPGVGMGMSPPQYLKVGDNMELSIDNLGCQKQRVVD